MATLQSTKRASSASSYNNRPWRNPAETPSTLVGNGPSRRYTVADFPIRR